MNSALKIPRNPITTEYDLQIGLSIPDCGNNSHSIRWIKQMIVRFLDLIAPEDPIQAIYFNNVMERVSTPSSDRSAIT